MPGVAGIHHRPENRPLAAATGRRGHVSSSTYDRSNGLTGWAMFSAIWLVVAGALNLVEGLPATPQANNISSAFLFQDLKFWGWVLLIVPIVQLFAGFMVFS